MKFYKKISLYIMAVFYIGAGINHFIHPIAYLQIMPPWLPWHISLVQISGAIEIILGLLLLPSPSRKFSAWALIMMLIAVFPANIQMMWNYLHHHSPDLWLAIVRLPLQPILIWWAYIFTKR